MKTKRIEYIDLANVIATFAVVFLHANSCFWDFSKERYWITADVIESVFYFCGSFVLYDFKCYAY